MRQWGLLIFLALPSARRLWEVSGGTGSPTFRVRILVDAVSERLGWHCYGAAQVVEKIYMLAFFWPSLFSFLLGSRV